MFNQEEQILNTEQPIKSVEEFQQIGEELSKVIEETKKPKRKGWRERRLQNPANTSLSFPASTLYRSGQLTKRGKYFVPRLGKALRRRDRKFYV